MKMNIRRYSYYIIIILIYILIFNIEYQYEYLYISIFNMNMTCIYMKHLHFIIHYIELRTDRRFGTCQDENDVKKQSWHLKPEQTLLTHNCDHCRSASIL